MEQPPLLRELLTYKGSAYFHAPMERESPQSLPGPAARGRAGPKVTLTPLIFSSLALVFVVAQARAEYRTIFILVKQGENKKLSVTIHSDDVKDRKAAVGVDEAVKAITGLEGWGSGVGIHIPSERGVRGDELKNLLVAITDNHWLELESFGRTVPKQIGDHFLKQDRKK